MTKVEYRNVVNNHKSSLRIAYRNLEICDDISGGEEISKTKVMWIVGFGFAE